MRIALNGAQPLRAAAILIALLYAPLAQAEQPAGQASDKPENTVKRLYRDYAWQAIGTAFDRDAIYLLHQGMPELEKYFEPGFARLIRKGDECEDKIQDMCTPDFDYIFDAQDPAVDDLKISPMDKRSRVRVKFSDTTRGTSTHQIEYKMVQTPQGWRIADIYYAEAPGGGLRDSLLEVFEIVKFDPNTPLAKPEEPPRHFPDTPEGAVQQLYYDYAWQAIGAFDLDVAIPIENQSQPELEKYFESGLAKAIRADRDCTDKTGKKCALDGSILFNSRKPFAVDLDISQPDKKHHVAVTFKNRESKVIRLRYDMVRTEQGWRVYDIHYATKKDSLRAGLKP